MKNIKDNDNAQVVLGQVIQLVLVIVIAGILMMVGVYINEKVSDKTELASPTASSGTLTFSGNASCGETITVTNASGAKAVFSLNVSYSAGCTPVTGGNVAINMPFNWNTSTIAAINTTTALNANDTVADTMTASNPSAGVVKLTYNTITLNGNLVTTTETITNGVWGAANLTGGRTTYDTFYNSSEDAVDAVETGFDFMEIIILAIVAGLVIFAIFSYLPIRL